MDLNAFLGSLLKVAPGAISDMHFKVGSPPLLRIHHEIKPTKFRPLTPADTKQLAAGLMGKESEDALRDLKNHDAAFSLSTGQRFRVNVFRQRGTFSVVMRVISAKIPTVEELGLPPIVKEIAMEPRGLVLVTGITGSGKSSTLAAMVNHVNHTRRAHILTVEDPIEFVHEDKLCSINQRELGTDTDTFAQALRQGLRQDPDVILVGEMRDYETVDIALKAAETGHLVLSTLHTLDAPQTINRIIDVFPAEQQMQVRMQISTTIKGIISQRLVPRADGKGRVPAVEILRTTATVRNCIQDPEKTPMLKDAMEKGKSVYQTQSFDQHLSELFKNKIITREIAVENSTNPADFERALDFE